MRLPTRSDRFNFTETLKAEIQNKSMRYNNDPVNEEVKDPQVETPAPVRMRFTGGTVAALPV